MRYSKKELESQNIGGETKNNTLNKLDRFNDAVELFGSDISVAELKAVIDGAVHKDLTNCPSSILNVLYNRTVSGNEQELLEIILEYLPEIIEIYKIKAVFRSIEGPYIEVAL